MQVIFLPSGSGPSRNFQIRLALAGIAAAAVVLSIGIGGGYLGYRIGNQAAGTYDAAAPEPRPSNPHAPLKPAADVRVAAAGETAAGDGGAKSVNPAAAETRRQPSAAPATGREPGRRAAAARPAVQRSPHPMVVTRTDVVNRKIAEKFAAAGAEKLAALQQDLQDQRTMINESRRRLGDQIDSLGQRLGQIQAHVSRLNALGQRLTDMADLDRDEFSFDNLPAVGGPERRGPWERIREPELIETLHLIEIALEEKENELEILEALLTDRELHEKQYPQGWPTAGGGWMSSGYGNRTDPFTGRKAFHEGVDIAARRGSEVRAMAAGVVSYSGQKPGYGLVIEINHGNGYETRYAHAETLVAKVGHRVEKGDTVALVGSTGRSTGSHVHIEVLKNGKAVNPGEYLKSSG